MMHSVEGEQHLAYRRCQELVAAPSFCSVQGASCGDESIREGYWHSSNLDQFSKEKIRSKQHT